MILSRIVSEINGDFGRTSQKISTACVFCVTAEGVPFENGYRRWESGSQRTRVMGLPGRERSLTYIFSCVDTVHQHDRRTPDDSQTALIRIASRGKYGR